MRGKRLFVFIFKIDGNSFANLSFVDYLLLDEIKLALWHNFRAGSPAHVRLAYLFCYINPFQPGSPLFERYDSFGNYMKKC